MFLQPLICTCKQAINICTSASVRYSQLWGQVMSTYVIYIAQKEDVH